MKVAPVSHYAEPRFPTHAIFDAHPELLRLVPSRWRNNQAVLTVLASLCLAVTGCKTDHRPIVDQTASFSKVAPIFLHGGGQGAFGCVSVTPPVFLSEVEARQVIVEEGKRAGVLFTVENQILPRVNIPVTDEYSFIFAKTKKPRIRKQALELDGTDVKEHISYEYISQEDFRAWEKPTGFCTASLYDIIGTAKILRQNIAKMKPKGAYAIFYDPVAHDNTRQKPLKAVKRFTDNTMAPFEVFSSFNFSPKYTNNGVTAIQPNNSVQLIVDSDVAKLNGEPVKLPCKVIKINGAIFVPLRAVAKLMQRDMRWDQNRACVYLSALGSPNAKSSTIVTKQLEPSHISVDIAFADYDSIGKYAITKEKSRTELRQQVRDFITWLKGQGVI